MPRMIKNRVALLFLAIFIVSAGWFSFKIGYKFYKYYSLDSQAVPTEFVWSVKERASDRYTLDANYLYTVNGAQYSGQTELYAPVFKNKEAAKKYIKETANQRKMILYSSHKPGDSSIHKELPIKDTVYTIILWGLFFYFLWLGFYFIA